MPNDIEKKKKKNLDSLKKSAFKNITPKSLKEGADIWSPLLCSIWAEEIVRKGTFPKNLKNANVTRVFKWDNLLLTENYKPVSILPTVSKMSLSLVMWIQKIL